MKKEPKRNRRERKTIQIMLELYCHDQHGSPRGKLCPDCEELRGYVMERLEKCPHGIEKPPCNLCQIHCYKPLYRQKIRSVMRYSGPIMLKSHPLLALLHLWDKTKTKHFYSQHFSYLKLFSKKSK